MSERSKEHENGEQTGSMNRRKFCVTAGNTAMGIVGAGAVGVLYKFLSPGVILEIPPRFQAGSPDNFRPGTFVFNETYRLFIARNEAGHLYTLSSVCTHLGCLVNWKPESVSDNPEGVIACPCHGSIFDSVGNVLTGPAPRPLDRYRIRLVNGILIVDTSETVNEDEMFLRI